MARAAQRKSFVRELRASFVRASCEPRSSASQACCLHGHCHACWERQRAICGCRRSGEPRHLFPSNAAARRVLESLVPVLRADCAAGRSRAPPPPFSAGRIRRLSHRERRRASHLAGCSRDQRLHVVRCGSLRPPPPRRLPGRRVDVGCQARLAQGGCPWRYHRPRRALPSLGIVGTRPAPIDALR